MSTAKLFFRPLFIALASLSLMGVVAGCRKDAEVKKEVNLAIWGSYIQPELIAAFEQQSGLKVNVSNYTSNEELLAKVQAGSSGLDVAVPSDYMVSIMIKLGLLQEIDAQKVPNRELILSDLLNQGFDPSNKYSWPYAWGTAGIAVNRDLYKGKIATWKDVLDNPALKGKLSLLDDSREVMGAALKMNGYSVNTTNQVELDKAKASLIAVKPRVKMFRSDTVEALTKKEVAVAHTYSTDALQAVRESNGKIEYILPTDGGTRNIDTLVIFKGAQNVDGAHKLVNFMLSPEVNEAFVKTVMGGPVLKTTKARLSADLQKNASLFPAEATLAKFEGILDLGDSTKLYDDIWTSIKTE